MGREDEARSESTEDAHEDLELNDDEAAEVGGGTTGKVSMGDISIMKVSDKTSP
ncbi:MAG: hypothetical protein ACRDL2_01295 [Gaiellaceae bacterium]